jgi:hypothetical protein
MLKDQVSKRYFSDTILLFAVLTILALDLPSIELYNMSDMRSLVTVDIIELHEGACKFAKSTAGADALVKH